MVKISKVQLFPNAKNKSIPKPKFLNVIRLAQFSGVRVAEKSPDSVKHTYENPSLFQLQQKLNDIKEECKAIIKNSLSNIAVSDKHIFIDLNEKFLTQKIINQLRNKRLLHKNCLKDIQTLISDKTEIPYINKFCSDIQPKQIFTVLNDSMFISPRFAIHYIKGENTISHYNNVKKLKKMYSSCSIEELFSIKTRILNKFSEYTNGDSLIPDDKFSKAEIKKLKQLAEKYDAIDNLLKTHNIHTSAIETLFYSGINKPLKAGDILPNKDVMLGFSNVYDRCLKKDTTTVLTFANTDLGYRFKTYRYDENLISNIEKYKKQVSYFIRTKNYKSINDLNNKILKYLKTMSVGEVFVEPKDIAGLQKEMKRCPDMTVDKISNVVMNSKNNTVYYIKNLKNFDIKRYYNVTIPLIKCLREFGKINSINEVYIEALAANNVQHSPVGMYIRYGFEPISISKEEIEKDLYKQNGFDYKRSVWLVYKL